MKIVDDKLSIVKKRLTKKAAVVRAFMNSEIGKDLVSILEDEFYNGALFDDDPHKTAYNCGRRDVVMYLKQLATWRSLDE